MGSWLPAAIVPTFWEGPVWEYNQWRKEQSWVIEQHHLEAAFPLAFMVIVANLLLLLPKLIWSEFLLQAKNLTHTILSTMELLNSLLNIVIFRNLWFVNEFFKITTSRIKSYFFSLVFKVSQVSNSGSKLLFCGYGSDFQLVCSKSF